jgi:glucose-1-phosphate cytidylyltransferase
MKVVLFCGGLGMRLREFSENIPKPLVSIGYRPIIWHLMKYYAHFGHKDFILCLGYRGDAFKKYFLEYDECMSNDFTLSDGGSKLELGNSDIRDWRITFVDTGMHSNIGQRLVRVKKYLENEEMFLANYSDGLTDMDLREQLEYFNSHNKIASFLSVKPNLSYHTVFMKDDVLVGEMRPFKACNIRVNGGFFVLRNDIFEFIKEGEELVQEPFYRLIEKEQLIAYEYNGFWGALDTFKDKQQLDELYERGNPPWQVWKSDKEERICKPNGRITRKR